MGAQKSIRLKLDKILWFDFQLKLGKQKKRKINFLWEKKVVALTKTTTTTTTTTTTATTTATVKKNWINFLWESKNAFEDKMNKKLHRSPFVIVKLKSQQTKIFFHKLLFMAYSMETSRQSFDNWHFLFFSLSTRTQHTHTHIYIRFLIICLILHATNDEWSGNETVSIN